MACTHLPPPLAAFRLLFPAGAELQAFDLGAVAQPALAPLQPFFRLLDVVVKAVDVLQAIPAALTIPPDPTQIVQRLPALVDAAAALAPLAPPLSVPFTVVSVLDGVIGELGRTRQRLAALDSQAARIERARARAAALNDPRLTEAVGCADEDLVTATRAVMAPLEALRSLIAMVQIVLGLTGGPPLPPWQVASSSNRAELTRSIEQLEAALTAVREGIPLP